MTIIGRAGRSLLSGYFILLVVFLYAPLVVLALFAFNDSTVLAFPIRHLTTKWFHAGLTDADLISALVRSAIIAVVSAAVSPRSSRSRRASRQCSQPPSWTATAPTPGRASPMRVPTARQHDATA